MAFELVQYEEEFKTIIHTIYEVFGIEMIVIDRWLHTLVNTFDYGENTVDVKINSVVGNIIVTGRPQLIKSRTESEACLNCSFYDRCEMEGVIGVPINYQGICVGVIAVLVRRNNKKLFDAAQKVFDILLRFSNIFVNSLEKEKTDATVRAIKELVTEPFNLISEPIVFVRKNNEVIAANDAFYSFFSLKGKNAIDKKLEELVYGQWINPGKAIREGELFKGNNNITAQVAVICNYQLDIWDIEKIIYFSLKSPNMYLDRPMEYRADKKMDEFWGPSMSMQNAKKQAINATLNSLSVLIEGSSASQNRELMKIISRYGSEIDTIPVIVDCSIVQDELEHLLFGDRIENPGHLWPTPSSAICLSAIDRMPQYLQVQLLNYMMHQRQDADVKNKTRIYATTTRSLSMLVERGLFVRDFYELLKENFIQIPKINDSYEDREYYLRLHLNRFAKQYEKEAIEIDADFLMAFLQDKSLNSIQSIREAAEFFILHVNKNVLDYASWCCWEKNMIEKEYDKSDLVLVQLQSLLDSGFSKKKIAEKMGISRATLYRWIKQLEEVER